MSKKKVIDPLASNDSAGSDGEKILVRCSYPIMINSIEYSGVVEVDKDTASVLFEMLSRKRESDMAVHVGRNLERQRLLDGTLIVRDADTKQRIL
jgi:hypothetical protein